MKKNFSTKDIVFVGMFSALVFVFSNISIVIPLGGDNTRLHLGNVLCIVSGLVLGGKLGGLSSGIGSFFFDLSNPLFIGSAPFTLIFKFFIGYLSGKIGYLNNKNGLNSKYNIIGGILGSVVYICLYISKGFISNTLIGMELNANIIMALQKSSISLLNALIAVAFSIPISMAINKTSLFNNK